MKRTAWSTILFGATVVALIATLATVAAARASARPQLAEAVRDPSPAALAPEEVAVFLDTPLPRQLAQEHIAGAAVAVVKDDTIIAANGTVGAVC